MTTTNDEAAQRYVDSQHGVRRLYATNYLRWLRGHADTPPLVPYGLSTIAARTIRANLDGVVSEQTR